MTSIKYVASGALLVLFVVSLNSHCTTAGKVEPEGVPALKSPRREKTIAPTPGAVAPMPLALDELPTSIVDSKVEAEGVIEIDEYKDEQSADLIGDIRAFLASCDAIYLQPLAADSVGKCYADSVRSMLLSKSAQELRHHGLAEHVITLKRLRTSHDYREVFDPRVGLELFQYRRDSPWYYAFYNSHQVFDGGFYEASRVAVLKREAGGYRIHSERILRREYDLYKSPPRDFVDLVHTKRGNVESISLKEMAGGYEYELFVSYAEGTEVRKGTLSDDGWILSEYLKFDYCVNSDDSSDSHDRCYERELWQVFDLKTKKVTSAKGHYVDTMRVSEKTIARFKIENVKGLEKAIRYAKEESTDEDQLRAFFQTQIPKNLLSPVEWVY